MKKLKNFLDYLFYKYYWFQVRVGNKDIAIFTAILSITFTTFLYVASITMIILFFIISIKININPWFGLILIALIFLIFYMTFLYKKKFKYIINNINLKKKNNLPVILISLFAFILINACWILKLLQNQGKI